ncbi:hypothetical protein GCM10010293_11030 [Streptomyces griseoflavus]|nr:hypothetical protein GCM10010293_11030 [Streptomyces griseoflavus]
MGRGPPGGILRAESLAKRPAATAAAPAPITAVTAAAVALTVRTPPSVGAEGAAGQWAGARRARGGAPERSFGFP